MTNEFLRNVELYKRGLYEHMFFTDRITKQGFSFHKKQIQALEYLNDNTTTYIGYGGAARGGKSAIISLDALFTCYAYPESVNLIGRKNLKTLWETTWKTLLRMLKNFGFKEGFDYKYNGIRHELTFENDSIILAKNLSYKPSDVEATDFGSLEILRAYIDQSEHVPLKIVEKVGERVGTHFTTTQYGLKGKVLEAFNPSASHVKRRYWTPFKNDSEKITRKLVRALPSDNPGREAVEWVKQKEQDYKDGTMSKVEYEKQIKGNFDYDDGADILCSYDDILLIFENKNVINNKRYITADIARLGSDKAIIAVWFGWVVKEFVVFNKSRITEIQESINNLQKKYQIPKYNCIADEDGVGGGVVDNCDIRGFINISTPLKEIVGDEKSSPKYQNLKTQCGYKLATQINRQQLLIDADITDVYKQEIVEEIEQLRSYKTDDDGKLKLKPKTEIKEAIGRSPDWLDTLLMRSYFDIQVKERVYSYKTIGTIPKEAKHLVTGLCLKQHPDYYVAVDLFIDGFDIYLKERLRENNLVAKDNGKENSFQSELVKTGIDKNTLLIGNKEGSIELLDLRSKGYNVRGVKDDLLKGVKTVCTYNLFVLNTSLNIIRDLDKWFLKNDSKGKPTSTPDGKEPESLNAIRNAIYAKALWQNLIPINKESA